jgi:hypothetical protein
MMSKPIFKYLPGTVAAVTALLLAAMASAATIQEVTEAGEARADAAAADQNAVEAIADQTDKLEADYATVIKVVDGLKVYNGLLQRQIDNQVAEKTALAESIDNVALIERQIIPLMTRMIDSLEEFIELDTPFLIGEREARLQRLKAMMERSDVTAAEKFRQVLEAYSIEADYGRTIEAYSGSVNIEGAPREVDFLRIGRVSLTYQSVGGNHTGAWSQEERAWVDLPPETYKSAVALGLRIADKQVPPDLVVVPVPAAQGAGQ